jgi:ribosomal protein S18 acetylase RimI-like enzyme
MGRSILVVDLDAGSFRMRIERVGAGDDAKVAQASNLFDGPARADATRRFLSERGHHLLLAYLGDTPVGFVTGVELTHPDKGTEMLLYELGVARGQRRRGIGTALVAALVGLAREVGCAGMWALTDQDNRAALATYRAAGAVREPDPVMLGWQFLSSQPP